MTQAHGIQIPSDLDSGLSLSSSRFMDAPAAVEAAFRGGLFAFSAIATEINPHFKSLQNYDIACSGSVGADLIPRRPALLMPRASIFLLFCPDKRDHCALRLVFQLYSEGLSIGRHCHVIHPHNLPVEFVGLVDPDVVHLG
jgi:hypothetical protein